MRYYAPIFFIMLTGVTLEPQTADFISKVGFPIAVAVYVLVRLNGKFDRLTQALEKLHARLEYLSGRLHEK